MKSVFSVVLAVFLSMNLNAQQGVISGTVIDRQSGEPIAGATIIHISSGTRVMTDFDGNFTLSTSSKGIARISVAYVSYEEVRLNRVIVQDDQPVELMIKMRRAGSSGRPKESMHAAIPQNNPRS